MSATKRKSDLIQYARSLGFDRVGVTRALPLDREAEKLKAWISKDHHGSMGYMAKSPERRADPQTLLPGAKSVIALAMSYASPDTDPAPVPSGLVARYTSGKDYHKVIGKRLESFVRYLEALAPGVQCHSFVDTGPLLERAYAQRAGLGFIGKNTMLITKGLGSWVFLASILTTAELPEDAPDDRHCGTCRLCIDACPTQALSETYSMDARRCISYLTIENREQITEELREKTGSWIFGCDICQEVCPHNVRQTGAPRTMGLAEILSIPTEEVFKERFSGTAFMRAGRDGLVANACVAAANLGREELIPLLNALSSETNRRIRTHAQWALRKLSATSNQTSASSPRPEPAVPAAEAASPH